MYLIVLISSSCVLSIAYFVTLLKLNAAMKNLLQDEIATERRSVLYQFTLFITSYFIRLVFYTILLCAFTDNLALVFWWQLLGLSLYIPWNFLPVFYILWCHQRTYRQTLKAKEYIRSRRTHASNLSQ